MTFRFSDEDLSSTAVGYNNSNKLLKLDSNGKVPTTFLDLNITSSFSDVLITQPIINGQTLKWNSVTSKWENKFLGETNTLKSLVISMTLSTGNTTLNFPNTDVATILYLLTNTVDTKSITLYSAVNKAGLTLHFKRLWPQNSNIIIYPAINETIDNQAAQILTVDGQSLTIQSNGENWIII